MDSKTNNKLGLITVVAGEKYERLWAKTRPRFEAYASRIGAELVVIGEQPGIPSQHWAKLGIYELLKKRFDRYGLHRRRRHHPGRLSEPFRRGPRGQLGIFNEGKYTPRADLYLRDYERLPAFNSPNWDRIAYYNTGVMVVSRAHRYIFKPPEEVKRIRNSYGEQTWSQPANT